MPDQAREPADSFGLAATEKLLAPTAVRLSAKAQADGGLGIQATRNFGLGPVTRRPHVR